ncbi:retrotransposon protein, putative, ty1-copia subclass [Tanacetum coccineum]
MFVIEQPLPAAPAADSAANVLLEWNAVYDAYNEVACLILGSMTAELHRHFENSSPYDMIKKLKVMFEKQAGVERFDLIQTFHACKQEEGKPVVAYVIQMKGYVDQLERLGYVLPRDLIVGLILKGLTKDFSGLVRNYNMHNMGKTVGELHVMLVEYEKGLPKKAETSQVMMIKGGKIQKANKKSLKVKGKGEAGHSEEVFKNEVENQPGKTIKALRSDQDGKYISQEFKDYLKACGIVQQLTPPYTPQHNGVSERRNRTLLDMVRSMMNLTTLPLSFWDYALESATRILNMVPTKKALMKRDTPNKLQQRSVKCIFIGYLKETMCYYFYFPSENKIVVARYAEFFEKNLITQEVSGRAIDLEEIQDEDTSPSEITSEIPMEVEGFEPPQEEDILIRRSERTRRAPNRLSLNVEAEEHSLGDLNEPTSYKAAMLDSESNKPKIDNKDKFELKDQFLKELPKNTFSNSDNKDANEHIEKVLEIVDLFHVPNITVDQLMLQVFPISLTEAESRWLRNEPTSSIKTWEDLKTKFLKKYCPPSRTAKKMKEINNFQQEPDETLYQAWELFKELLMKCPQYYLTEMHETAEDAQKVIQEIAEYSQKWHNGTSRGRSTETSDGLAAIQAQLNNLGREIKKNIFKEGSNFAVNLEFLTSGSSSQCFSSFLEDLDEACSRAGAGSADLIPSVQLPEPS